MATAQIDPDALAAGKAALVAYLSTLTVFGVNIGTEAPDSEITTAATNTIQAYLNFLAAPKI